MEADKVFVKLENPDKIKELFNNIKTGLELANQEIKQVEAIREKEKKILEKWYEKLERTSQKISQTEENLPQGRL